MTVFVTALVVWGLCGLVIASVLARHGHNFWVLAGIGLAYGPFLSLIWLRGMRGQAFDRPVRHRLGQADESGWIDVLVGLDGTPEAVTSTHEVIATLGPAVRRLRLVSVIDYERAYTPVLHDIDDERLAYLERAASAFDFEDAELVVTGGQPDRVLLEEAEKGEFDLIVVAHRRDTLLSGIRGSTSGRLARRSDLPVLIGPSATG